MIIQEAMEIIKKAIHDDPEYAWGWHCNVAMAAYDEGLNHAKANKAAARFMRNCWSIDTTRNEHWNVVEARKPCDRKPCVTDRNGMLMFCRDKDICKDFEEHFK